ncbi:unnamed protein product [Symbiodinium sp. KB8]|nr:unnamed protein product [Symbiodinium sp. KB8]
MAAVYSRNSLMKPRGLGSTQSLGISCCQSPARCTPTQPMSCWGRTPWTTTASWGSCLGKRCRKGFWWNPCLPNFS